jgi:phage terminase large subunit-like protein
VERQADRFLSLGWALIQWMEHYLCHGPGDLRGEPIRLDPEFAAFIVKAYEVDENGRRKVNRAFLSRPKGRAKSELAGMIVCAEALGPVRFDHFDADGNPVGRPVKDPFIRCLATEEGQAGNTYDNVQVMLGHLAEHFADDFGRVDVGLTRVFLGSGGEIRPSTAASASKDGGKETFVVADETHLWVLPELRSMHDTVTRNLVKRKIAEPWMLETSTMYQPGHGSVAESTHDYHRSIASGDVKNRGLLFDHQSGTIPEDWEDDEQMVAGLRESYGAAAEWMDFDRILGEIRDPKTTKASACRYFLNKAVAEEEQWVTPYKWAALTIDQPELGEWAPVALGFDGSDTDDNTALIAVTMSDPPHVFTLGIWGPPEDAEDWHVPRASVRETVKDAFKRFQVAAMFCDPPYWRDEIADWAALYGDKVVIEFPTASWSRMAKAVDRLGMMIQTGALTHDDDRTLAQHIVNARKSQMNSRRPELGFVLVKDRPNSPRKIDAAVAACLAVEARAWATSRGWKPKPRRPRTVSMWAALQAAGEI